MTHACTRALIARAKNAHARGESETAFRLLDDPRFTVDRFPGACFLKARMAMASGLWNRALPILNDLIEEITPREDLRLCRAECLLSLGRLEEAAESLKDWHGTLGTSFRGHVLEARIAAVQGRDEQAYTSLALAMKQNPDQTSAMAIRAPELARWALGAYRTHCPVAEAG